MQTVQTAIMLISLALIIALAAGLYAWNNREKLKEAAGELKDVNSIKKLLEPVLFQYVTAAERTYGSGTGRLKLAAVVAWIVDFLPDKYKGLFSVDQLTDMVEKALRAAKEAWKQNPALIAKAEPVETYAVGFDANLKSEE